MRFKILNSDLVKGVEIDFNELEKILNQVFSDSVGVANIVFLSIDEIREMNKKYRDIDEPTDVLSFNYSADGDSDFTMGSRTLVKSEYNDLINNENVIGEIFVSPEYLESHDRYNIGEVVRMIIHGILHILGYEHKGYFSEEDHGKEEMFLKQEKILNKILMKLE